MDNHDPYVKTVWRTGDIVTSVGLNNIENELEYLDTKGAIYVAVYGSTSYNDVNAALNRGEQVICERSNKIFTISSRDSSIIKLSCVQNSTIYTLSLTSANAWSESSSELILKPSGIANGQTVTYNSSTGTFNATDFSTADVMVKPSGISNGQTVTYNSSTGKFVATDFSTDTFYAGTSAPSNKKLLWIDTTSGASGLKYWNGSAWVAVPTFWV